MTQKNDLDPIANPHLAKVIEQAFGAIDDLDAKKIGIEEMNEKSKAHANIVRAVEADTLRRINSAPASSSFRQAA
jgi:hypothetical protein